MCVASSALAAAGVIIDQRRLRSALPTSDPRLDADVCYKFIELDAYFRKHALAPVSWLREGRIDAILREYGIDLKWDGSCPDKTFMKSGRAYVKRGLQSNGAPFSAPHHDVRAEPIDGPASAYIPVKRKQA